MPPETKRSHDNGTHEEHPPPPPRRHPQRGARRAGPAPVTAAPPAPGDPAAAVHAALAAGPDGATTARIATVAGISRPAARDALTALETAGTVTCARGGKPGIPDTWTLTGTEGAGHEPGAGHGHAGEPAVSSQPAGDTAGEDQNGPGQQDADGGTGQQEASAGQASPGTGAAVQEAQPDDTPAGGSPGEPDTATGPEQADAEPGPAGESPAAEDNTAAGDPPDPALAAEAAGRVEQIQSAASAAASVLAGGDLRAALAGIDEIYDQAAQARRALKAAAGGKKATAARPGGLREKVLGHLRDHPGESFTPHEIHKVLSHSSGAIANALDTLVNLGDAELAAEKPRKFRFAGTAATPAQADETGGEGELAGAA